MSSLKKLNKSKQFLEKELTIYINYLKYEPKLARISVILRDGTKFYVRYNNHNEYSYTVIFSKNKWDRIRFDNYDDKWIVKTRPNHFHPRYNKDGFFSPMNGLPEHDIPLLSSFIKSGDLFSQDFRF